MLFSVRNLRPSARKPQPNNQRLDRCFHVRTVAARESLPRSSVWRVGSSLGSAFPNRNTGFSFCSATSNCLTFFLLFGGNVLAVAPFHCKEVIGTYHGNQCGTIAGLPHSCCVVIHDQPVPCFFVNFMRAHRPCSEMMLSCCGEIRWSVRLHAPRCRPTTRLSIRPALEVFGRSLGDAWTKYQSRASFMTLW